MVSKPAAEARAARAATKLRPPPLPAPQVIPKTLAVNAAKDATDLVARLRAFHYTAQSKEGKAELARVRALGAARRRRCQHR